MSNCQEPKRLMKRQSSQPASNATAANQTLSQAKARAEDHHNDSVSRNNTEQHFVQSESIHRKNQTDKSDTEHSQPGESARYNSTVVDHSKDQSRENTASNHATKETPDTGGKLNSTASNSSSALSLNTSITPDAVASASSQAFNASQSISNNTAENPYSPSITSPLAVQNSPTQLDSPNNSTSPVNLQSPTSGSQPQDSHHSKGKVWGIAIGTLAAIVMVATAIFFIKKRLKGSTDFVRRHLRSRSNDSNRAVRDRSSLEPQFGVSDPFACSSTFSKKPLVLRPESLSHLRTTNPRRPSVLHLRNQSIKSQISPPIIEPPSPASYRPLSSGSPAKYKSGIGSHQASSHVRSSSPSWYQNQGYPPIVSKYHLTGVSQTRDPYTQSSSVLAVKNPDFASGCYEDTADSPISTTHVPPRPPRPEWPVLPFDSTGIKSFSKPVEEPEPALPAILPLNVSRRLGHRSTYTSPRDQSIDQMILESPESCHDSPTLPQYRPEEDKSAYPVDREADATRASHLSRSTCYSQSSEAEIYPMAGQNVESGLQTPNSLRYVSFGPSSNSTQLERQLDYFTAHKNRSDRTFSSRRNS
ncbi:hypothetical protein PGT21_005390 [Puccinia graminis f. sp. tritici]|uniref:Uncharacterized protein n=2 Tax=Puccinia graminis f. sp. tritici TaxID=56615 RepID=E3JV42_PUCGT|nr:uncharacterized protein PGTG_01248 [Puccinia graminis f. sp. tritici CRL 75-36-700-3]KAA1071394.1 hypothetical protein PGT21_005824 [Puccinia graminis f. sp. tritici]EFP75917.1 hypothetical protein PGTG_01248 [Puccinia graminis f. sp. tritici CRL 75-36-700-3]KAA1077383.1 hypothetical protein PGT21_005390 [Puccinia graminis f. sp. tritici]KAA1085243.1 hypothetical protein PGTUg99_013327 [Puccinia graminis f. sp. tritici]KAA1123140.1 hypothetical protein PGTUg99_014852 [Puccinia graminis f. s